MPNITTNHVITYTNPSSIDKESGIPQDLESGIHSLESRIEDIRLENNFEGFKSLLKTHLIRLAFDT